MKIPSLCLIFLLQIFVITGSDANPWPEGGIQKCQTPECLENQAHLIELGYDRVDPLTSEIARSVSCN